MRADVGGPIRGATEPGRRGAIRTERPTSPGSFFRYAAAGLVVALLVLARSAHAASDHSSKDPAAAAAAATVTLQIERCPPSWEPEVRRALQVEIGERLAPPALEPPAVPPSSEQPPSPPRATQPVPSRPIGSRPLDRIAVNCDGGRALVVARSRAAVGHSVERSLAFGDLPPATAPRIVALAGLELLATLDPELRRELAAKEMPLPEALGGPRLRVVASGVYRSFTAESGLRAWGGALVVHRSIGERFAIGGGAELDAGGRAVDVGETRALLASGSIAAGARLGGQALGGLLEIGVRGGVVRLSGTSAATDVVASTVVRPWAGPFVAAHAQLEKGWLSVELAVEGGLAVISASGFVNDGPALVARGPWFAISVGCGLRR